MMRQVHTQTTQLGRFENATVDTWTALWSVLTACTNEVSRTMGQLRAGDIIYQFEHPDEVGERLANLPENMSHRLIRVNDDGAGLEIHVHATPINPHLAELRHDATLVLTVEARNPAVLDAVRDNVTEFLRYVERRPAPRRWPVAALLAGGAIGGLAFSLGFADHDLVDHLTIPLAGAALGWALGWCLSVMRADPKCRVRNPYSRIPDGDDLARGSLAHEIATACRRN